MSTSPMSNTPNSSPTMLTPNPWMPMLTPSPWMQQSVCVRCAVHSEHEDSEFGRVYSCSCLDKKNPRTMKLLDSEALARIWATPTPTPTPARCEAIYLSRRDRSRSNVDRTEDLLLRMDENEELWGIPSRAVSHLALHQCSMAIHHIYLSCCTSACSSH